MRYTSLVSISVIISLFIIPSSLSRVSSIPYSEEEFTKHFRFDPINATQKAVHSNHLPYIYRLNFSDIPPFISDKILDAALNDDFPGTKIAEAIQTGTILKISTWKRLTQTQLATRLFFEETIRDASPDLSILNPTSRDGSIHDNAKMSREDILITQPSIGATSHTDSQKVTITGLENLILSYPHLSIKGNNIDQFSISSTELSFEFGTYFEIQLPRNSLREPIYPQTGVSTTERRLISIHNATNVRFTTEGNIYIENAAVIQLFSPDIAHQSLSSPIGPSNRLPVTITKATGVVIKLLDLIRASPEDIIRPVLATFETTKEAHIFGMQATGVKDGMIDLESKIFSSMNLNRLTQESIEFSGLSNTTVTMQDGMNIIMENDSTALIYLGPTEVHYYTHAPTNLFHIDPTKPHALTITGSTLSFIQDDFIEEIKAGNQTRVTLTEQGGFSCAYFTPFSSYTRKPQLVDQAISIITFKKPHTVCTTTNAASSQSCTRDCTIINIPKKTLIQHGPADIQYPSLGNRPSVMTSYGTGTTKLSFDESFSTISNLDILDKEPILIFPTPAISITEQGGHRLLTLERANPTHQLLPPRIKNIRSPQLPLFQIESTFAYQLGKRGKGVYILFPNNPHIQELILLTDKRMERSP